MERCESVETQTLGGETKQLGPFETYELLHIRSLVNNLNYDNEVLQQNTSDLKVAFIFLLQEHKNLLFQHEKEKRNKTLLKVYRSRIDQLAQERNQAIQAAAKLAHKNEMLLELIRMGADQCQQSINDQELIIEQLLSENQ